MSQILTCRLIDRQIVHFLQSSVDFYIQFRGTSFVFHDVKVAHLPIGVQELSYSKVLVLFRHIRRNAARIRGIRLEKKKNRQETGRR